MKVQDRKGWCERLLRGVHTQTLVRKGRISILVGNPDFFRYSGRSLLKASLRPAAALSCVHLPPTSGLPFLSSSGSPEGSWQSKLATPGPSRPLHTTGLHPPQGLASLSADGPRLAPALLPHLCSSVTFSMTLWSLRLTNNPSPAFVSLTLLFFFFLNLFYITSTCVYATCPLVNLEFVQEQRRLTQ